MKQLKRSNALTGEYIRVGPFLIGECKVVPIIWRNQPLGRLVYDLHRVTGRRDLTVLQPRNRRDRYTRLFRQFGGLDALVIHPIRESHVESFASNAKSMSMCFASDAMDYFAWHEKNTVMPRRARENSSVFTPTYLKSWRKFRDMSQEDLAAEAGMTAATISRLENGKVAYTQPVIESLADALDCDPSDIISRPPEETHTPVMDMVRKMEPDQLKQLQRIILALSEDDAA